MTQLPLSIDPQHPSFEGHFPSRPIVPGVVLLDCCLRAIEAHRGVGQPIGAWRIGAAKFLSIVGPGEPLRLEIEETSSAASNATSGATSRDGYRLQIFAGGPDRERLALSGNVSLDPVAGEVVP